MECGGILKLTLAMAVLGIATSFVCSYSLCGILFNKTIAILFGVILLILSGYYGFFIYKMSKISQSLNIVIFAVFIDIFIFSGSILCFVIQKSLFSTKSDMSQFAYTLFISFGLYFSVSLQWPTLLHFLFKDLLESLNFSEMVQYSLCFIINFINSIITSLLLGLAPDSTDQKMMTECSLRAIGVCFVSAAVGAIIGFVMQIGNSKGLSLPSFSSSNADTYVKSEEAPIGNNYT